MTGYIAKNSRGEYLNIDLGEYEDDTYFVFLIYPGGCGAIFPIILFHELFIK